MAFDKVVVFSPVLIELGHQGWSQGTRVEFFKGERELRPTFWMICAKKSLTPNLEY